MKSILLITSLFLVFTSCDVRKKDVMAEKSANAETKAAASTDVTTVQIIDSVYNFGSVKEGEVVEFNFRFKNSGNKPLVIINASASCGCTIPEKPEQPIKPGETGFIKAKFNTDKRPGEAMKTVTVSSNAQPGFPELVLKGTVVAKSAN